MTAMDRSARSFAARPTRLAGAAALAVLALTLPRLARAEPIPVVSFEDAANDATGPGTYTPPGDTGYQDGDFDLRRFAVLTDGEDVLFVVTLGAAIRSPPLELQTGSTPVQLQNGIYLQNIDIYLDTGQGSGSSACIPGRRVTFADGRTWKAAVVLTPQPGPARAITREALGRAADHVVFAEGLTVRGRTITARVPAALIGGAPRPSWGYSVHVSGARWERTFAVGNRLRGTYEPDAFTMPVLTTPEAFAFGGAPIGDAHPRVVDVLLPPGVDQREVLGSYDLVSGRWARVPFVYAQTPGPVPLPTSAPEAATLVLPSTAFAVVDASDTMVTISGPVKELKPMQLGQVLGPRGELVARLVIVQVLEKGAVASVVPGGGPIAAGASVTFHTMPGPTMRGPAPVNP
jgi:carbohydrate-binding DOMON domain-containing protein